MHNFSITVSAAVYLQASAFNIFSQFSQKSMKKKKPYESQFSMQTGI